jgi:hypothetical protein
MRTLFKSKLLAFRQCPERLCLDVFWRDLSATAVGASVGFTAGHSVGEVAQQLYDPTGSGERVDVSVLGLDQRAPSVPGPRLAALGVEHRPVPGREDGFSSLCYGGEAFAHFHNDNELDIRLTRSIIDRKGLAHPRNSVAHPNRTNKSHWIELRRGHAAGDPRYRQARIVRAGSMGQGAPR